MTSPRIEQLCTALSCPFLLLSLAPPNAGSGTQVATPLPCASAPTFLPPVRPHAPTEGKPAAASSGLEILTLLLGWFYRLSLSFTTADLQDGTLLRQHQVLAGSATLSTVLDVR